MAKFEVTIIDKHGDQDVVTVYAQNIDSVVDQLDQTYGDDYQSIVCVESL